MNGSFKGAHFPKDVILHAVFFYLRYGVSYHNLGEIMAERGVMVGPCHTQPVGGAVRGSGRGRCAPAQATH